MTDRHEQLVLKLLDGTISDDERASLQSWMNESPEHEKFVTDLTLVWQTGKPPAKKLDFQTADEWARFESTIDTTQPVARPVSWYSPRLPMKVAASIILLALTSWLVYWLAFHETNVVKESNNQIVHIPLPDGSEVWLNRDSRLVYPDHFTKGHRTVRLQGEGFFSIKKDAERPFVVQTMDAAVKVLGTTFNVQAFDTAAITEVYVASGAVSFSNLVDHAAVTLKPGETATLTKRNHRIAVQEDGDENALAWKNKKLLFRRTPMEAVIKSVEHYFKVHVEVTNKNVLRCRFTGSFDEPSLEEIVEALSVSLDLTITKKGNTYVVNGTGC